MSFNKLSSKMEVNKKLLPIKGHYFFFNAGTAPLVPYLSTYARQLGFSSTTVGLIYTVLPIFGLVAKPLFGVIADRFKIQKLLFILFQIVTIVSFSAIYFVPENKPVIFVGLDCDYGVTMLRSCYNDTKKVDLYNIDTLSNNNVTTFCDREENQKEWCGRTSSLKYRLNRNRFSILYLTILMTFNMASYFSVWESIHIYLSEMNCNMSSPMMWQTVCEHWHIPKYCYSNTDSIEYTTYLDKISVKDDCGYISASNVTLDGYTYTPGCRRGDSYVDIDEPCKMHCLNAQLTEALGSEDVNMTCLDERLNYRTCSNVTGLEMLTSHSLHASSCEVFCELDKSLPWKLMEICEGWKADDADSCRPKTKSGGHFPSNLSFTGAALLSTAMSEHDCMFIELHHIILPDGSIRYPYCLSSTKYQPQTELFETFCEINCDNELVNEVLLGANESHKVETSPYTRQFWMFFILMIISWIGQAVVVTFADAICFNLLGTKVSQYGKQRLWGSVGWGVFSLLTGTLIDVFSDGAYKDYTVAFVLMFIFMTGDVIVSGFLKIESTKMSMNILADVGTLLSSVPTFLFLLWTIAVGLCTGLLWQFLFWLLEDVSVEAGGGSDYIKTLQGLVSAIQTFCGEIPFLFVSGYLLRKVGHANMMSLVLFAFGVRFILYSFLSNPWWVLPIEMLQGITFGMFYPTMTSYANIVSPPGTETTVQGLVGAVFEGVGTSLGSYIGGHLYAGYGGWKTFRWFGYGSLICGVLHVAAQYFVKSRMPQTGATQGYTAVIRYEQPTDMVYMLEDMQDSRVHDI